MRELSATWEELSGSVQQPNSPWYRRLPWPIVGLALVALAAVVFYAVRRKRARPA